MAIRSVNFPQPEESNVDNNMKELRRRSDKIRKAIQGIQANYIDK